MCVHKLYIYILLKVKVNSAKLGIDTPHALRSSPLPIFIIEVLWV